MKLSEILKNMAITEFEILSEKEFQNLSLLLPGRTEKERCVFVTEKKYLKYIDSTVKMVIGKSDIANWVTENNIGMCVTNDPRILFFRIHNFLSKYEEYQRKRFTTKIGLHSEISSDAKIPSHNIVIGDNVIIEDRVTLVGHVEIGDNSIIHSGTVIGAQGNDFKMIDGKLVRTAQIGGVKIGRNVEIDQNCCIERPTFPYEDTVLGNGTKLGALSFISHGVQVGERTQIKGMVNIAGYTAIGDDVFIGPGSTISNLITIGNDVHITIGSVVASSVLSGKHITGNFAIDHDKFMHEQMRILRGDV